VAGTTPGARRSKSKKSTGFSWEHWWSNNLYRFLDFSREDELATASADYLLGKEDPANVISLEKLTPSFVEKKLLPALTAALDAPEAEVRAAAVKALGRISHGAPVDLMARLLNDDEHHVRFSAAIALGDAQATSRAEELARLSVDRKADPMTRGFAILALGLIGEPSSLSTLEFIAFGKEPNFDLRTSALVSIGLIPGDESRALLRKALANERFHPDLRALAIDGLARQGIDDATAEMLFHELFSPATQIRRSSILALGQGHPGCPSTGQALADAFSLEKDMPARAFACIALGEQKGPRARKLLLQTLTSAPDTSMKSFAALGLGILGDETVVPYLVEPLLKSSVPMDHRNACAVALGIIGSKNAVAPLEKIFREEKSPSLRGYTALALGMIGERRLLPDFEKALASASDPAVIEPIALSIGLLGGRSSSRTLLAALERADNDELRAHLIHAVGHLKDHSFVDPFLAVMQNPQESEHTRVYAAIALGHLGDTLPAPRLTRMTNHRNYMIQTDTLDVLLGLL